MLLKWEILGLSPRKKWNDFPSRGDLLEALGSTEAAAPCKTVRKRCGQASTLTHIYFLINIFSQSFPFSSLALNFEMKDVQQKYKFNSSMRSVCPRLTVQELENSSSFAISRWLGRNWESKIQILKFRFSWFFIRLPFRKSLGPKVAIFMFQAHEPFQKGADKAGPCKVLHSQHSKGKGAGVGETLVQSYKLCNVSFLPPSCRIKKKDLKCSGLSKANFPFTEYQS